MNHDNHVWMTIAVAIALALLVWKLNVVSLTIYTIPMYFSTALPDLLEPAISPHHRQYFHSKRFFKILSVCLAIILVYSSFIDSRGFSYFFGTLGYLIHMQVDGLTKRGMPN